MDIDKLESLAKAATQGDWKSSIAAPANGEHGEFWLVSKGDPNLALGVTIFDSTDIDSEKNAAYIEAVQPNAILALIAEVRALREGSAGVVAETLRMAEAQSKLQRSLVIQECADAVADLSGDEYSPGWNNAISDAVDRLNAMRGAK